MTPPPPARVGRTAFALGIAGLLPQAAAVTLGLAGFPDNGMLALGYPLLILSFLGGMWWGLAMRREGTAQGVRVALAVVPSLLAAALAALAVLDFPRALVATGVVIVATLAVDRWLVAQGDAPANWMRLRVPLSGGLGALTILAGLLAADVTGRV